MSRRNHMLLMLGLVTVAAATQFGHVIDDPLITMRYAHNLLAGHGLVFNIGDHVEGFTSPLHLVVAVIVELIPGGANLFKLKLASLLFTYLAAYRAVVLIRRITLPKYSQIMATVMFALSWALIYNVGDALETTMSVWLIAWLLDNFVSRKAFSLPWQTGAVSALAYLARPENGLIIAVFAVTAFARERDIPRWHRVRWALVPIGTLLVVSVSRLAYYGELLPNTYYAKGAPLTATYREGFKYLSQVFTREVGGHWQVPGLTLAAGIASVIALAATMLPGTPPNWQVARRYCLVLIAAQVTFVLASGGTGGYRPRFVAAMVLPIVVLTTMGCTQLFRRLPKFETLVGSAMVSVVAIASFAGLLRYRDPATVLRHGVSDSALISRGGLGLSAIWVAEPTMAACAPLGATVATSEIGLIGVQRPDLTIIDMRGLTNKAIAHHSPADVHKVSGINDPNWYRSTSAVGREILRTQPTIILTFDHAPLNRPILEGEYRLAQSKKFEGTFTMRGYARVGGPCDSFAKLPHANH